MLSQAFASILCEVKACLNSSVSHVIPLLTTWKNMLSQKASIVFPTHKPNSIMFEVEAKLDNSSGVDCTDKHNYSSTVLSTRLKATNFVFVFAHITIPNTTCTSGWVVAIHHVTYKRVFS